VIRIATILAAASAACATAYQPRGFTGGYDEAQLGENVFRISFEGNGYTSSVTAADYALLRSADVTLERGFKYFAISNNASPVSTGGGTVNGHGWVVSSPSTINMIVCFKEKPEGTLLVYDAKEVRSALRGKYDLDSHKRAQEPPPRVKPIDPYASDDK
jgi:hypothetical protein